LKLSKLEPVRGEGEGDSQASGPCGRKVGSRFRGAGEKRSPAMRDTMKKNKLIIVGLVVLIALIGYFSKPTFWRSMADSVRASTAEAQEKPGSMPGMPGMPGMPAEKPAAKALPSAKTVPAKKTPDKSSPEQAPAEAPTVEIPADKRQLIGVKVVTASVQPLTKTIRTVGIVEYDQRRLQTINTKIEGWVEKLYVNFSGTYVNKGDPVADIYSPELWATQQEFINVVRWAKKSQAKNVRPGTETAGAQGAPDVGSMIHRDAQALVEAARQRLKLWDISDDQIKKIEDSEKLIRTLTIYSPYSGYVLQKNVVQGMRIMAGASLLEVADLSTVWLTADIYEFEMPLVKVGDAATVRLSYFPGRQFSTKIDYIYPTLQGETRTVKARFTIPNEGGRLKPQMFTNVELKINLGRKLAVPSDAVINTGVRQIAYVDKGDGNFEPREVVTGVQAENLIEITAGLKVGDKVSSSANFLIDSEAKLKGVEPLPRQKPGQKQAPAQAPVAPPPGHQHGK
jgi:membrane fusion protein, copper/silver efflux system